MTDKRIEKLINKTINKKELEALLTHLGFHLKGGKGSHQKWVKPGCLPIILATHDKEIKKYQIKNVITTLFEANILERVKDEKNKN